MQKKYIVIGNPIKHSLSPLIHNYFFDKTKKDCIYNTFLIKKINKKVLDSFFESEIQGINVTLPFKKEIIKYLYDTDEIAKRIGSVNTLKYTKNGYIGYNTDIYGIEDTFKEQNIKIQDKKILILGAGGSGYTAVFTMLKNSAKSIIVANRTLENAKILKNNMQKYYDIDIKTVCLEEVNRLKDLDVVINTTTVGFLGNSEKNILNEIFFNNNRLQFIFDIIYTPPETGILKQAKKRNILHANGFSMLVYQALESQKIWQGIELNIEEKIRIKDTLKNYFY